MAIIPRSRVIIGFCLLANAIIVVLYIYRHRPGDPVMESLATFVLDTGKETWVPAIALNQFGLPYDDLKFYELRAKSESGKTKAIQVRYRKSGEVVFFLLDLLPNSYSGCFYLTDTWPAEQSCVL